LTSLKTEPRADNALYVQDWLRVLKTLANEFEMISARMQDVFVQFDAGKSAAIDDLYRNRPTHLSSDPSKGFREAPNPGL